jgi:hypothetical protein
MWFLKLSCHQVVFLLLCSTGFVQSWRELRGPRLENCSGVARLVMISMEERQPVIVDHCLAAGHRDRSASIVVLSGRGGRLEDLAPNRTEDANRAARSVLGYGTDAQEDIRDRARSSYSAPLVPLTNRRLEAIPDGTVQFGRFFPLFLILGVLNIW